MEWRIIALLAQQELREARRNRWFLLMAAVFGGLALLLSYLGLSGLGTFGVAGFGRTTASLLHLVMVIVPLMGLLLGAMSVAVEREHGTLLTVMAQPVTAAEVLAGKWCGNAAALVSAILLGFGVSGIVIARYGGLVQLGDYAALVAFTLLLGLAHLAVGLWLSVMTRRGATALGLALACWLLVVIVSDLCIMGTAMVLELTPPQLLWASLINPVQIFKLGVIGAMGHALDTLGPSGRYAADVFGGRLPWLMMALLIAWITAPLASAFALFRRQGAL